MVANAYRGQQPYRFDRRGDLCDLHRIERAPPFRNPNVCDGDFSDVLRQGHGAQFLTAGRGVSMEVRPKP